MYRHFHRFVSFVAGPLTVKNNFLLVAVMLLCTLAAQAQTIFPVQSTTRILPPYSVYLADYAVNGNDKLQCILVNRDATQTTYQVRLRLTVKLNGRVIMQTSPSFNPTAITLSPNVAQVFAGATLEPYLKSENLDFVGYSRELYEQNRALPEGFYEIGFAAFDYYRQDVQVSNDGYGFYFLAKNEPPLLNLPACGSKIQPQYSSLIRFSWMPRNTASVNSGNSTYYRYFLYEINPRGTNPNDIANSLPPIYVDSTPLNQTFYDLLPTPVLFRDTFEYVWRVQAVDINGADLFRNNGFSEVCTFTWGGPGANPYGSLDSVLSLNAIGETERKGKMWWTKDAVKFDGYKVYYKKSGSGYNWFTSETEADTLRVFDLQPDTEYECRIQGRKNGSYGMYSDVRYFRTKKIIPVECNNVTDVPVSNNNRPMISLQPGAVITYRDFEIRTTDSIVSTQAGWFSGKGEISLPFLGGLVFAVKFNNIYIDDAGMVSQGEVHFVSRDLQEWWKEQRDQQAGGNDVGDVISGKDMTDVQIGYDIESPTQIQPVLPTVNGYTNIVIVRPTPPGGYDTLKNVPLPYTIKDKDGDIYTVDKDGNVVKAGKSGGLAGGIDPARVNKIDLGKAKVTFKPHPAQLYGFDAWQERFAGKTIIEAEYEKLIDSVSGTPYYVASKAVEAAKADKVIARIDITDPQYKADSVKFATGKGTVFSAKKTSVPNEYEITIVGGPGGDAQELYALYPKAGGGYITLGKLKIAAYNLKRETVVLVPVGIDNAQFDENAIVEKLKKVYGKVAVQFSVRVDEGFRNNTKWDLNGNGSLDVTGSGILADFSAQTAEMKQLKKEYRTTRPVNSEDVYIFLLKKSDDQQVGGDMPRGSRYGYIFVEALNNDKDRVAQTTAHEIGHGKFVLKHTFSETIGLAKGSTGNLMDYQSDYQVSASDSLYKYQWDQIHDPGRVGLLEEDEESEYVVINTLEELKEFANQSSNSTLNGTYTFLTPAGKPITLPKDIKQVKFSVGEGYDKCSDGNYTKINPLGSLVSFRDKDSVLYSAITSCDASGTFRGYTKGNATPGHSDYYKDIYSAQLNPSTGIIVYPCFSNDFLRFTARKINLQEAFGTAPAIPGGDYYGSGARSNTLFTKAFSQVSGKEKVIDNVSPQSYFNHLALDFLKEREGYLSECGSKWTEYIFVYANQINYYPDVYKTCILPEINRQKNFAASYRPEPYNPYKWGELVKPASIPEAYTYDPIKTIEVLFASQTFAYQNDANIAMNNQVSTITGAQNMRNFFKNSRSVCTFNNLTAANRVHALAQMASGAMYSCEPVNVIFDLNIYNNCAEDYAAEIVKAVPENQAAEFITKLKSQKIIDDLMGKISGKQRDLFIAYLTEAFYRQATEASVNNLEAGISNVLSKWNNVGLKRTDVSACNAALAQLNAVTGFWLNGSKIRTYGQHDYELYYNYVQEIDGAQGIRYKFTTDYRNNVGSYYQTLEVDAFDWVYVLPTQMHDYGYPAGMGVVMPAFVLKHLMDSDNAEEVNGIIKDMVQTAMILTFTYEAAIFSSVARSQQILMILDMGFVAADFAISELASVFDAEFIEKFETFSKLYLAGRLTPVLYSSGKFIYEKIAEKINSDAVRNLSSVARERLNKVFSKLRDVFGLSTDYLSRLNRVVSSRQFTEIFNRLPRNTAAQQLRYTTRETFRDEFLRLHTQLNGSGVASIDDVVRNFENMINRHAGVPGIERYIDEMMQAPQKFKGGAFGMEILADLPQALRQRTLVGFESSIDDLSDCRFDMEFSDGTRSIFTETKNYAQSTLSNIANSSDFFNQFKEYLSQITSVEQFKYIFRSNPGVTVDAIKNRFRTLFTNKKQELFNVMQSDLKIELGIDGANGFSNFDQLITNTSSDLYNFVILK